MKNSREFYGILVIFFVIILSTNYVFYVKLTSRNEFKAQATRGGSRKELSVEEKILSYAKRLPKVYTKKTSETNKITLNFIENIRKNTPGLLNLTHIWMLANSWISKERIIDISSKKIGQLHSALKLAPIIKSDLDIRGTQLKLLLELHGGQEVVFKPKWYEKDTVIPGLVYSGKDRHTSEIAAFYLSVVLNLPFVPFSTFRTIPSQDILSVSSERLLKTTFNKNNTICIYGKCFYCSKSEAICLDKGFIEGAVIFNINFKFKVIKSPWIRTYKTGKKARWELDKNYCKSLNVTKNRILDIVDVAIFDFLIQNGDRHHYELYKGKIVLLDNGKGLGNPYKHHLDILAPLYQCCVLRKSTLSKLLSLGHNKLSYYINQMPDVEKISRAHLEAMDNRILIIYATVEYCKNEERLSLV